MKSKLSKQILEGMENELDQNTEGFEEQIDDSEDQEEDVEEAYDSNLTKVAANKELLRHMTKKANYDIDDMEDEDDGKETHFAVRGRKAPQPKSPSAAMTNGGNKRLINKLAGEVHGRIKQHAGDNADLLLNSVMRESYIKTLRTLLENEVEQAGVLMAAKGFSQEIQTMVEKMGRLMNEELGPVVDNMRMAYGAQQAEAFAQAMRQDMQSIMDNLLTVKDNIDDAVDELAAGQIPNMSNDMEGDDIGAETELPDQIGAEFGDEPVGDDMFGGDESASGPEEDPLGRPQKESIQHLQKQLIEMKNKINKLKKIKESKKA